MVLSSVKLRGHDGVFNIGIDGAHISFVSRAPFAEFDDRLQLNFENAIAFPGLINSHDHLEFNLFPQLGYKTYANYVEWGDHIHQNYKAEINRVLNIPIALRAQWGVYKNLICGVTTVLDHGPKNGVGEPLITVYDHCQNLHSVRQESSWKQRLNNPIKINTPTVIHIGEGTDEAALHEIDELLRWNILHRQLIGIHGVAMQPQQAKHFKALVWCPQSNYFLLNKTAAINELKQHTSILFGSDSTLTGNWDMWDHIRMARKTGLLTDDELYDALTTQAAEIWKLNKGSIAEGKDADIIVARSTVDSSFFDVRPEDILLVIQQGNIRLFDESLSQQLTRLNQGNYSTIDVNGAHKYVQGDIGALIAQIQHYYPEAHFPVKQLQHVH